MNRLDALIELSAHVETMKRLIVPLVREEEERENDKLRKAAARHHAPTTITQSDSPSRERRTA